MKATAAPVEDPVANACANCGAHFAEPRPKFCPACGQETNIRPPRLMEFVQQLGGAYFSTEGALWRTLKLLLFKPGELTRQYLAGRRKHYVLPLRLYLTISLVALLAIRVVAGVEPDQGNVIRIDLSDGESTTVGFGSHQAGMKDGVFFCTGLPDWLCARLKRRIDVDAATRQRDVAEISQRFLANVGVGMFAMLPLFALLLAGVYWNRGLRYTEHLVFALHVHAFWFVAQVVALLPGSVFSGLALIAIPGYTLLAMRRVYGGRWWPRLLRALLVGLAYVTALGVVLISVGLWTAIF